MAEERGICLLGGLGRPDDPDGCTAPASAHSEVIHAPNRALRRVLLDVIDTEARVHQMLANVPADQRGAFADLPQRLAIPHPREASVAKTRADKQILAIPTHVEYIEGLMENRFTGSFSTMVSVLSEDDALALALLPANQRYFNEIEDAELRCKLITLLLRYDAMSCPDSERDRPGMPSALISTGRMVSM